MSVIVSRMVSGVAGQAFWYLAGPLAPPSVWKRATAPTWLARLGAPGGSPRHRRGSPSLRGLSDPCPPSARAVPVLSSPSLPTTAHPVLAPTTTYHPPISRWAVSLRIPPHPVGTAWAGPQSCLAPAHSNQTQPGGGGPPPF